MWVEQRLHRERLERLMGIREQALLTPHQSALDNSFRLGLLYLSPKIIPVTTLLPCPQHWCAPGVRGGSACRACYYCGGCLRPRQLVPAGSLCLRKAVTPGLWGIASFCKQTSLYTGLLPPFWFHFLKVFQNKLSSLVQLPLGLDFHLFLVIF